MSSILKIGTSIGTLTALDALATPVHDPAKVVFYPYARIVRTGSGGAVTQGAPYAVLTWRNIRRAQRDQLRTYCTTPSAVVYWTLPTNESNLTVANYYGIMTWPLVENYYIDILTDFNLYLYNLVAA